MQTIHQLNSTTTPDRTGIAVGVGLVLALGGFACEVVAQLDGNDNLGAIAVGAGGLLLVAVAIASKGQPAGRKLCQAAAREVWVNRQHFREHSMTLVNAEGVARSAGMVQYAQELKQRRKDLVAQWEACR